MGTSVYRLMSLSFFASALLACASSQQTARDLKEPASAEDFLVPDGQVGGLSRSAEKNVKGESINSLDADEAQRWQACAVLEASQARYQGRDPKTDLTLRVLVFAKPWDAFCAFTPGRSEVAHPVLDIDGAFEDKNFARSWRGPYLVEVSGDMSEQSHDRALGLLRATVARMPVDLPTRIPEQEWFPESMIEPESEKIAFAETIPGLKAAALTATAKCEGGSGLVFAMPFSSSEDAKKGIDAYQQRELENFSEVEPYTLQGLSGAKIVAETGTHYILLSNTHLVGVMAVKNGVNCSEILNELAIRSSLSAVDNKLKAAAE